MRFFLLAVLTGLLLLTGCGQKGSLYIPKEDANPVPSSVTNLQK
ncbi:MAG: putative small lipoprotein YifL [Oleispira sp.]|jgi:predicted small lipoprotein YifL